MLSPSNGPGLARNLLVNGFHLLQAQPAMSRRLFPFRVLLLGLVLAGGCIAAVPSARADNSWNVIKYGNGEYLTLRNVAPESRNIIK